MDVKELLGIAEANGASDLHLCVGMPPMIRVNGMLKKIGDLTLNNETILEALKYVIPKEKSNLPIGSGMDFAIEIEGIGRFRANIYSDIHGVCSAIRVIPTAIKTLEDLGIPEIVNNVCNMERGLVLVTGSTGSGKSTTLAAIINKINSERCAHIITIEDPVEFVHQHKKCIINQRELGVHVKNFPEALRSALREDPDVILVGEMRDLETISMAITAAETGHLVLATLHTKGAIQSIDRMIDVFPALQQEQIRVQLSDALEMVLSQALITSIDRQTRYPACEIMVATHAIRNLIREQQTHQIKSALQTGSHAGMITLEQSIKSLLNMGKISEEEAMRWVQDKHSLKYS